MLKNCVGRFGLYKNCSLYNPVIVNKHSRDISSKDIVDSSPSAGVDLTLDKLPKNAKVVICGGGVLGASVAYHLAELGWGQHTIVLEQGRLGGGTTYHSSGLVGVFKPSRPQVKLCQESVQLYKELEAQGYPTGWKQCGSLCVARTHDRITQFRRMQAQSVVANPGFASFS